jgi:hypothetical protein
MLSKTNQLATTARRFGPHLSCRTGGWREDPADEEEEEEEEEEIQSTVGVLSKTNQLATTARRFGPHLSCRTGGWREDPADEEAWEEEEEEEEEEIQSTIGVLSKTNKLATTARRFGLHLSCRTGGWREDPADEDEEKSGGGWEDVDGR